MSEDGIWLKVYIIKRIVIFGTAYSQLQIFSFADVVKCYIFQLSGLRDVKHRNCDCGILYFSAMAKP